MDFTIKGKTFHIWSWKRIVYTLCFFMFCLIDQRTKTGSGREGYIETFRNMTGSIMAVILLSHCKWGEIRAHKLPYLLWTILGGAVGIAYVVGVTSFDPFVNGRVSAALAVFLTGYALIHTVIRVAVEKKYPVLEKKFLAVWGVMMFLMIFSRSDYIWPLCYLVMFGCFYLTDYTAEEREDLFQGCLNGIILGFFVFQGFCCVFRPYDSVRYQGMYNNPNLNALFYLEVLAAVFAKILYVTKNRCSKWIRLYYWLGAGVVLTFELLTIGRTGWVVAVLMIGGFLWMICKLKSYKKWFKNLMALSLCVILTFPICFSATRYLPPVFHHPVWFWGEWSEGKVHSWDPWNSEKFVDIDEYLDAALGRIGAFSVCHEGRSCRSTDRDSGEQDSGIAVGSGYGYSVGAKHHLQILYQPVESDGTSLFRTGIPIARALLGGTCTQHFPAIRYGLRRSDDDRICSSGAVVSDKAGQDLREKERSCGGSGTVIRADSGGIRPAGVFLGSIQSDDHHAVHRLEKGNL